MNPGSPRVFWIVAILFTGAGLAFSLILPTLLTGEMRGFENQQSTMGTVITVREKARAGVEQITGDTLIRFTDETGRPQEFLTSVDAEKAGLQRGDTVEVFYNRSRSEEAELRLFVELKQARMKEVIPGFRILGYIFLVLGIVIFIPLLVSLHVKKHHPEKLSALYWWMNFLGGLTSTLTFALTASLAIPGLYLAYLRRPNMLFEKGDTFGSTHIMVGIILSIIGVAMLVALWFIAPRQFRERPRN